MWKFLGVKINHLLLASKKAKQFYFGPFKGELKKIPVLEVDPFKVLSKH